MFFFFYYESFLTSRSVFSHAKHANIVSSQTLAGLSMYVLFLPLTKSILYIDPPRTREKDLHELSLLITPAKTPPTLMATLLLLLLVFFFFNNQEVIPSIPQHRSMTYFNCQLQCGFYYLIPRIKMDVNERLHLILNNKIKNKNSIKYNSYNM